VPLPLHTLREPGSSPHAVRAIFDVKLLESAFMRITEAARRLGTSARMLRYREDLGLLPQVRDRAGHGGTTPLAPPDRAGHGGTTPLAPPDRAGHGGTTPLAPPDRAGPGPRGPSHRQFSEEDVDAVAAALELERRYDISPASLAFGVRVLAEPGVRAAVADLGRRLGRIPAPASRALDFEKERALRLLQGR
jgi:MerR family transcriptional regulator, copper efflux regulator